MSIAHRVLPPFLLDTIRWLRRGPHSAAIQRARYGRLVPGSPAYGLYKRAFLVRALADEVLLARFRDSAPLPDGYGAGLDERCVEYPWLLTRLDQGPERILDAGSVLNYDYLLAQPRLAGKDIHILTLAPEESCFWHRRVSYLFADLRDIPMRDGWYDTIACVSTLEHVGGDNRRYTGEAAGGEHRPEEWLPALRELIRVLRPGGRLLLTVPFGRYEHHGWLQQFDAALLGRVTDELAQHGTATATFYRYTAAGWVTSDAEACADCRYHDLPTLAPDGRYARVPAEPDHAAAARAAACLEFLKA